MKGKFVLIAVTAVLLFIGGCRKTVDPVVPSLSVSPNTESVTFSVSANESYTFMVTTNQPDWDAVSDKDWCIVDKDHKNNTFIVTAKKNNGTDTPEPATVTVTAGEAAAVRIGAVQDANSIYVCGDYYNFDDRKHVPCYWKDGKRFDLEFPATEENIETTSIAIENGTVYIIGNIDYKKACIWIDGKFSELSVPADAEESYAYGIDVNGGNVYVSGTYNSDYNVVPCYWVNNECKELRVPEDYSEANAYDLVFVDGKMYIPGDYNDMACLWVDGKFSFMKDIPDASVYSRCSSIAVSGDSQYIAGYYLIMKGNTSESQACYWKNGVRTDLEISPNTGNSFTTSITMKNGTAYISGFYYDKIYNACYWTDEKRTDLSVPDINKELTWASSVFVADEKVYISGYYASGAVYPCYWINGEVRILEIPEDSGGTAKDIIIAGSR